LMDLMEGGEHSAFPNVESIRICTKISRTMEEILQRFESGDLRPDADEFHRPRASRRRPPPTRADREAKREHRLHSDQPKKPARKKAATRKKSSARSKPGAKAPKESDKVVKQVA